MVYFYGVCPSPVGDLYLVSSETALRAIIFSDSWKKYFSEHKGTLSLKNTAVIQKATRQLTEYFSGSRASFDIPLEPEGTLFQLKAWKALQSIPYGATISYSEQAVRLGNRKACRAVGGANNKNPLAIVIPCHRVIGKSGNLIGYAGGLSVKEKLLDLELSQTH